jgi:hypothetical protein
MNLTTTAILWLKRKRVEKLVRLQLSGLARRGLLSGDVDTAVQNVMGVCPLTPGMRAIESSRLAALLLASYAAHLAVTRESLTPYAIASLRAFLGGCQGMPGVPNLDAPGAKDR